MNGFENLNRSSYETCDVQLKNKKIWNEMVGNLFTNFECTLSIRLVSLAVVGHHTTSQ